jgi:hypothetical protein
MLFPPDSPIGKIDYDLTNIVMNTIALSQSDVTLETGSGLQISVHLDVSATLNWHYHCWAASDGGSADLKLSGASVSYAPPAASSFASPTHSSPPQLPTVLQHERHRPLPPRPRRAQRRRVCCRHQLHPPRRRQVCLASSSSALALSTSPPPHCLSPPSWLYNLFVSTFKGSIKNSIVAALHDAVNPDAVNKDLANMSEARALTR